MNVKIRDLLIKVIEKTNTNELSWEDKKDFLEITLKNGVRVAINRVRLSVGAPQFRYILDGDNTLVATVNPWDEDMGYEVWLAVYQSALENVKLKKNSNLTDGVTDNSKSSCG